MDLNLFLQQYGAGLAFAALALLVILTTLVIVLVAGLSKMKRENAEMTVRLQQGMQGAVDAVRMEYAREGARSANEISQNISRISGENLNAINTQFVQFASLVNGTRAEARESSDRLLANLEARFESFVRQVNTEIHTMRLTTVAELASIRESNDKAQAEIRDSVQEKLQQSMSERISESFRTVESQLRAVHQGLGEMREMAQNVDGLRRVLTNVKTRGTFGEVQLGMIMQEILTPEQYATNVATRPGSAERVEFAVKLPGRNAAVSEHVWLPIDAKFPIEDYERLLEAREKCDARAQEAAIRGLEKRILLEAAKIRDKYIEVPFTTDFAVLYLPVESLWAEVLGIPGLMDRVRRECHITLAGPSVLAAFMNSLQMGFRTLAIEKRSSEVWHLLGCVKGEFAKFADSIESVEKKIDGVRQSIASVRTRTNVMGRHLKNVDIYEAGIETEDEVRKLAQEKTSGKA